MSEENGDGRPDLTGYTPEELKLMIESKNTWERLFALMEVTDRMYGKVPEPESVPQAVARVIKKKGSRRPTGS